MHYSVNAAKFSIVFGVPKSTRSAVPRGENVPSSGIAGPVVLVALVVLVVEA